LATTASARAPAQRCPPSARRFLPNSSARRSRTRTSCRCAATRAFLTAKEKHWPIVDAKDCIRGRTLLHWAVVADDAALVAKLLGPGHETSVRSRVPSCVPSPAGKGWSADEQDYYGWTPVHLAAANGRPELLRALLAVPSGLKALEATSAETEGCAPPRRARAWRPAGSGERPQDPVRVGAAAPRDGRGDVRGPRKAAVPARPRSPRPRRVARHRRGGARAPRGPAARPLETPQEAKWRHHRGGVRQCPRSRDGRAAERGRAGVHAAQSCE